MIHNNVQPCKSYITYEETNDEDVQVAFHDHMVNDTVKAATIPVLLTKAIL